MRFNGPQYGSYGGSGTGENVKLSQYVGSENKENCLVARGLPYKITTQEVLDFFQGYGQLTEKDVFIEEAYGKRTGSALIIFENKDVAQDAKANLQGQKIGAEQRYLELFDCYDQFMQKICNLYDE